MNLLIILTAKYLFLIILLIAGVFWFRSDRTVKVNILWFGIVSLLISFMLTKLLGYFIITTRPFVTEHVQPLIKHIADNGFPSDHTVLSMTIAAIIFKFNRRIGVTLGLLAVAVGIARILARIHQPLDIIGSIGIAIGATYIAHLLLKNRMKQYSS